MSNTGSTGSEVATITSGANTPNPSFVFNSYGTFYIEATVSPSLSLNYTGTTLTSLQITVYKDTPNIVFSPTVTLQSPYTYIFENSYEFTEGAATVTNNTGQPTGQTLIYSIVTADSTITSLSHSTVATIDPTGCFLNTVSCGTTGTSTFRIGATADAYGDYSSNVALSDVLTIERANPTILQYPYINLIPPVTASTLVYGQPYTITPDPSQISTITSNTDTNPYPNINYTSSDTTVAKISGTIVTIIGIGHFHILVNVTPTTNYNQIFRSPSTQIYDIIQAEPTIQNFPTTALSAQTWVYGQQYPGIIPPIINISTTNTDGPLITYSTSDATIATISGNTITIVGVGQFQILVTVHATTNFSAVTYTYPSGSVYTSGGTYTQYQSVWATPIITFLTNFTTSSRYGSTYVFVPPILSNYDPLSQSLTYSVYPANSPVATIKGSTSSPSFVINSVGTFQIQASCGPSTNGYYSAAPLNPLLPILSSPITISLEMPSIAFNTTNFLSQYTCQPASPYPFLEPIASITNNNVQVLTYSIVATDGVTPSSIATISSNGTSLTTNSVGSFQILATATATTNGDYGGNTLASETITIISATPTITAFPTIPSPLIYGNTYQIPYSTLPPYTITTTNTDASGPPSITYSSTNSAVATTTGGPTEYSGNNIIGPISGELITIVGVGDFQITVTIGATANYNAAPYTYPSPTTWYTAIQATPTITPFPSNLGNEWVIGGTYNLTSSITANASSGYTDPNQVTYSFVTNNNSVKMVAVGNGGTNSIAYSNDGINWTGIGLGFISSGQTVAWNGNIWIIGSTSQVSPYMVFSFNGINWFPVNNSVLTVINDIASSGPMWVAVGQGGVCNIAYSYDGIYWYNASASASNIFTNVNGVAWNGTMWVAVGTGQNSLAYSSDGINWNVTGTSTNTFYNAYDVAWNGAMWVAVGEVAQYTIAYSYDGIKWTGVSNSASSIFTGAGQGIAWNGSIWVAAGQDINSMAYSPDGVNWTGSSNSTGIISGFGVHVAWSGSLWVVVGSWNNSSGYTMAYSSDGNNWIGVTNSVSSIFRNGMGLGIASTALIPNTIASLPNTIVAGALNPLVGGGNTIFYSNDGMNWNPAYGTNNNSNSGTIFSSQCAGVAWNGSMWVAVGAGVNTIAYSINGKYWYPSNNSVNIFSAVSGGAGVAWNGSMWVAVGSGPNTIAYSPDGINWTGSNNSTTIFSSSSVGGNGVAWNGSMWVAVGYGTNNTIAYSTDGINWTGSNYSTSIFSSGNGIAWNGDMWVAVGSGTNNTIAWSNDGIGWSRATNSIGGGNSTTIFSDGCGIAWNGSMWVAVGDGNGTNNTIAYSYDGKEWTGVGNSIFLFVGSGVTWYSAYNIWVATGSGNNDIAYSSDGIHWSPVNNSASIYEGMAIASTSDVVFYTNTGNNDNNASFPSSTQITINDVGSFQIQASLSGSTNFLSAIPVISNIITITPSTISLTYNFANAGYVYGGTYTLPSNPTNNTDTNPPPTIIYGITTQSNSTGSGSIGGNTLTTTAAGGVYISITVSATQNFNAASFSEPVTIAQATPVVVMNSAWINAVTYSFTIGSEFGVYSLISSNSNTDVGLTYSLIPSIPNGIGTVSIENNGTVFCNAPGIFSLQVTSNATANFTAYSFQTPAFYVSVVPEVIIFNNPGTWPPNIQISGEVGMAICITNDSYPFGFNNYSALTITNYGNGATFTLNANTSPTYNSVIYKYMVFFEPNTANTFSTALSTSTASNIVYVGTNSLAGGVVSGQDIIFTFSGNTVGQGYPDPLIINWNPGSIDITQGWVYGAFYSYANNITPSQNLPSGTGVTVSTLMSGSIAGYFIAPWAGYSYMPSAGNNTTGVPALNALGFTALEQAWGIWTNINYGDQFGSTLTSDNVHYYYVGIPQITNPVTYH